MIDDEPHGGRGPTARPSCGAGFRYRGGWLDGNVEAGCVSK